MARAFFWRFVTNACAKLRAQNSHAAVIQVFLQTNRFRKDLLQYMPGLAVPLCQSDSAASRWRRVFSCVVGEVAGNGVSRGRQQAFPLNLKMMDGRSVAPARVVALGSLYVLGKTGHIACMLICLGISLL